MGEITLFRRITKVALQAGLMYSYYHFFTGYIYDIGICAGRSMEPTLYDKDLVIIDKMKPHSVQKWDVVIVRSPFNPEKYLCKRVVHLPGELVSSGPFLTKIHKGTVWLEGDNIEKSNDSREFGPVPLGLIVGKPVLRIWPSINSLKWNANFER